MRHCEHNRPPVVHPDAWRPISTEQTSGQLKRGQLNQCVDLDEPERVPREPGACHLGEPRNSLSPINSRLLFHLTARLLMGWSLTWRSLLNNRAVLMGWAPGGPPSLWRIASRRRAPPQTSRGPMLTGLGALLTLLCARLEGVESTRAVWAALNTQNRPNRTGHMRSHKHAVQIRSKRTIAELALPGSVSLVTSFRMICHILVPAGWPGRMGQCQRRGPTAEDADRRWWGAGRQQWRLKAAASQRRDGGRAGNSGGYRPRRASAAREGSTRTTRLRP